jgi:tetratricopeptide (TPR) repeat protein
MRGHLKEAEDWYRQALTTNDDLDNKPAMATTYGQLGVLAKRRGRDEEALEWTVRCVALFDEFPHSSTRPEPKHLARLAAALGLEALRRSWLKATGHPLPAGILACVQSQRSSEKPT